MFSLAAIIAQMRRYDFSFFGISSIIFFMGVINLYSATHSSGHPSMANLYRPQIFYFLLSLIIGVSVSFIRPKNFYRYSYLLYFFNIFLLILVFVLGHKGMGAQRWLVIGGLRLQPSEIMKVSFILAVSRWFAKHCLEREMYMKDLIVPGIIAFVPTILIVLEPDLGTGLLILLIFAVICFYRRLNWKTIAIIGCLAALSGSVMYKFGLKKYQRKRIVTFLNPAMDARGSGYNAIQSKIAIGSGRLIGKGFKKSSQASLKYLPENHTDFVFSIFNEEHGFFGSLLLISCYLILFFRFLWLASTVTRVFDSICVVGLMSLFYWHTFINMGMVMGLMPIVGLPLPLMSYGGSSLVTFGVCCGVATSISNSRNLF